MVAVDPSTGRILSIVNQRLALGLGFQPCSTIKVSVALAALSEKVIEPSTTIRLNGRRMDLTYALAHSNNYFFANLGRELGFETISYYAHQFGYGEKAGLNLPGEKAGHFPLGNRAGLFPPHPRSTILHKGRDQGRGTPQLRLDHSTFVRHHEIRRDTSS